MGSVADDDSGRAISGALAFALGGKADQFRNVVVVYETFEDTVGALSFACCSEHTLKLLSLGQVVVLEDPAIPLGQACPG